MATASRSRSRLNMEEQIEGDLNSRMQSAYDWLVDIYAQVNQNNMPESLVHQANLLIKAVGMGGKILDVGCGTGRDLAWFIDNGAWAAGIDLSRGMLDYAYRTLAQASRLTRLACADMQHLPFPEATFDGLWACASLLHLPKAQAPDALREFQRVLRPGGYMVIDVQQGTGETWEAFYGTVVERFFARYQPPELADLLLAAGFEIIESTITPSGMKTWISIMGKRI